MLIPNASHIFQRHLRLQHLVDNREGDEMTMALAQAGKVGDHVLVKDQETFHLRQAGHQEGLRSADQYDEAAVVAVLTFAFVEAGDDQRLDEFAEVVVVDQMGEDTIVDGDRGRHGFVLADSVTMRYPEPLSAFPREGVEAGDVVGDEKGDDGVAIGESDEDAFKV